MSKRVPQGKVAIIRFVGDHKNPWLWVGASGIVPLAFLAVVVCHIRFFERAVDDLSTLAAQGDMLLLSFLLLLAALVHFFEADWLCRDCQRRIPFGLLVPFAGLVLLLLLLSYGLNKGSVAQIAAGDGALAQDIQRKLRQWSHVNAVSITVSIVLSFGVVYRTIRCMRKGAEE